jgi:heavy metal sensor kinase
MNLSVRKRSRSRQLRRIRHADIREEVHWLRPKHVRTRLTLWYVLVLASVLLISWTLTAAFLFLQMRNQLDNFGVQDIETVEGLLYFDSAGRLGLHEDYHNHPESKEVLERLLEVRALDGSVLYRNERLAARPLGGPPTVGEGQGGYTPRTVRVTGGLTVRMVSRRHTLDGRGLLIRLGYSEEPLYARTEELGVAALAALPIVLAIAGLAGFFLARRALEPLSQMARRAEQITSESLHDRLPVGEEGVELGHLAQVFNGLLARLEQSFERLKRFTSDASHELRTPLTAIRSVGEVALQNRGTAEEYRDTIGSMLEEVNRLTSLVENLLTISRADAGSIELHPTVFSAMDLARESVGLLEVLIEEKNQEMSVEGDETLRVRGDRMFLRQALVNIIHNAVKYSPAGSAIAVRVRQERASGFCFEVSDSGPGIATEHSARIFDRFYRVDESRSREAGGAGLGLSIAQWAIRIQGGDIRLLTSQGRGCTFQICLPPASQV